MLEPAVAGRPRKHRVNRPAATRRLRAHAKTTTPSRPEPAARSGTSTWSRLARMSAAGDAVRLLSTSLGAGRGHRWLWASHRRSLSPAPRRVPLQRGSANENSHDEGQAVNGRARSRHGEVERRAVAGEMIVGAVVPMRGRYAAQGTQVRVGLELFARLAGAHLILEDDASRPQCAVERYGELLGRCELVLGPYGSDSVRAVARADYPGPLWNHGGAADDVQRVPGVVSVASPASRYLAALGRAVAGLRPGCSVALVAGGGSFARFACEGFEAVSPGLGLTVVGRFSLTDPPDSIVASRPDSILLCGPVEGEIALLRALRARRADILLGGLSPALSVFPRLFDRDPDGLVAVSQWHPTMGLAPALGPSSGEVVAAARARQLPPLDYVAVQAYACALIATHCLMVSPGEPLPAAQALRTSTLLGDFALDPRTGLQIGHRLCSIRWRNGRQELLFRDTD